MIDACSRELDRGSRGIPSRPCLESIARLGVLALANPRRVKALDHLSVDVSSGNRRLQCGRRFFVLARSRLLNRARYVGLPQSPATQQKKRDKEQRKRFRISDKPQRHKDTKSLCLCVFVVYPQFEILRHFFFSCRLISWF